MTRRRRFSLVSRVCIGMFLLLFGNVRPDATTSPASILEKLQQIDSNPATNRTLLSKLTSEDSNESISFSHEDRNHGSQSPRNYETKTDRIHINNLTSSDERASSDHEKGLPNVTPATHEAKHVTRSNDQLSTVDRRSRYGEIIGKSSGKSTSTKIISEDSLRLARTNGLNAATTKPALEDIAARYEEQKDKSTLSQLEITEEYDNVDELKRTSRDHEPTTPSSHSIEEDQIKKKNEGSEESKNKEEKVYGETGGEIDEDDTISLINDTNVNYNHFYKTLTGKKDDSSNQSSQSNSDSSSLPDSNENGNQDPKEEVEVIKNVTHKPDKSLKFVDNTSAWNPTLLEKRSKGDSEDNELIEKERAKVELDVKKNLYNGSMGNEDAGKEISSGFIEESTKQNPMVGDLSKDSGQVLSVEVTTGKNEEVQVSSVLTSNPIAMPKGRTITFSGVNEFSSLEAKSTAIPIKEVDGGHDKSFDNPVPKKNSSVEKTIDQKPYPYVKSTKDFSETMREKVPSSPKIVEYTTVSTTLETSAYENTIGRSETEKKFVITESSVVLENSIQQVKPSYDKTIGNDSWINNTTESQSSFSPTTSSLAILNGINRSNETFEDKIMIDTKSKEDKTDDKTSKASSAENDVPQGNVDDKKEITGNDANFDVTGNGITEVSPRADGMTKEEPNYKSSFYPEHTLNKSTNSPMKSSSTEMPPPNSNAISMKMDVQTDAEEAMLIRSTLNVSEVSTAFPLIKIKLEDKTNESTVVATSQNTSSIKSSTPVPLTRLNNTQETSSVKVENVTPKPNKTSNVTNVTLGTAENDSATTTSVEYEFVGLTETTVVPEETTEGINTFESLATTTINTSATELSEDSTTQSFSMSRDISTSTLPIAAAGSHTPNDVETTTIEGQLFTTTPSSEMSSFSTDSETTLFNSETEIPTTQFTMNDQRTSIDVTTISEEDISYTSTITEISTTFKPEDTTTNIQDFSSETLVSESSNATPSSTHYSSISSVTIERGTDFTSQTSDTSHPFMPHTPSITTPLTSTVPSTSAEMNASVSSTVAYTPSSYDSTSFVPVIPVTSTVSSGTLAPRIKPTTSYTTITTSGSSTERTADSTRTLSPEEITLLVRIVIEGTLREVCPHIDTLKQSLAEILTRGMDKLVLPKQVMFHQNPCLEAPASTPAPTPTDISLTSILVYVVDEDGKFDATMTKILPNLYKLSPINFPVTIHSFLLVQEIDSGNAIAVVVVSSVAFICLVLLAGLLFIMRKRQTRFNYGERCRPVSLDAYSLDSVSAYNSVRRKGAARSSKRSYGNPTFEDSSAIPSHPLNFAGLSSFCNDVSAINEEFSGIPQVTTKIDELPPGAEVKNRYANVIPLPETRVPLQRLNNDPITEYINASYVRGPKNATKYYIACQAPMESTVTDFWRMIWEQQSKVIIMLTDLVENGVEKCTEYIPPSEVTDCHRLYGDYQVTLKKRETKEKYAISTLHLKNLENNTFREVYHIWYLWPVNGVQSDGAGLIAILLEARALQRGGPGPIVVHCSPGTGRTGTLIALDLGIRQYEITRTVDVPRVVYTIRRDRAGAVQTKEQYAFIYKALNLYATKLAGGVLEST